jgi:hypothetical protein
MSFCFAQFRGAPGCRSSRVGDDPPDDSRGGAGFQRRERAVISRLTRWRGAVAARRWLRGVGRGRSWSRGGRGGLPLALIELTSTTRRRGRERRVRRRVQRRVQRRLGRLRLPMAVH